MARMTERIMVSDPVKELLVTLTRELSALKGRDLTYNDTIEELIAHVSGASRLMRDIAAHREAERLIRIAAGPDE
jgi:hypothetical protein